MPARSSLELYASTCGLGSDSELWALEPRNSRQALEPSSSSGIEVFLCHAGVTARETGMSGPGATQLIRPWSLMRFDRVIAHVCTWVRLGTLGPGALQCGTGPGAKQLSDGQWSFGEILYLEHFVLMKQ